MWARTISERHPVVDALMMVGSPDPRHQAIVEADQAGRTPFYALGRVGSEMLAEADARSEAETAERLERRRAAGPSALGRMMEAKRAADEAQTANNSGDGSRGTES